MADTRDFKSCLFYWCNVSSTLYDY